MEGDKCYLKIYVANLLYVIKICCILHSNFVPRHLGTNYGTQTPILAFCLGSGARKRLDNII